MGNTFIKFVLFLFLLTLFGCKNTQKESVKAVSSEYNDEKSYSLGTDDISELSGMRVQVENGEGFCFIFLIVKAAVLKLTGIFAGAGLRLQGKKLFSAKRTEIRST